MYNKDLTGKEYGLLTVLKYSGKDDNQGHSIWTCKCECGKIVDVRSNHLNSGQVRSCGCIKKGKTTSGPEYMITRLLRELRYEFRQQVTFDTCRNNSGNCLKFDFGVFVDDELQCLLEYQGEQHYRQAWGGNEALIGRQINDYTKKKWCEENKVPLMIIPYTEYNNINKDYLNNLIKPHIKKKREYISIAEGIAAVE